MLHRARLEEGLSQTEAARRGQIARPNFCAIESGRRKVSPEMAARLLGAIRGASRDHSELHLTPPVLLNVELSRVAAFVVARDPIVAREKMRERLRRLRSVDDGGADRWLDTWDEILDRWADAELLALLLSTDPDDVELRKVSPVSALVSEEQRGEALDRARELWRATR